MKYLLKNFVVFIIIFSGITAVFLVGGNFWIKDIIKKQTYLSVHTTINELSNIFREQRPENEIFSAANRLLLRNRFPGVTVTDIAGKVLYTDTKGVQNDILELFVIKYPVKIENKPVALLNVITGFDSIIRILTEKGNFYIFLSFFALWAILIAYLPYLYFRKNLLNYVFRFVDFFKTVDTKTNNQITFEASDARWKSLSAKLESIKEKYVNTGILLQTLLSISKNIKTNTELTESFSRIIGLINEKFPGISVAIVSLGDDGFFKVRAQHGFYTDFLENIKLKEEEGYIGKTFSSCEPIIFNDMHDSDSKLVKDAMAKEELKSFAYLPICVEGKSFGVFGVASKEKNFFSREKLKILAVFTDFLAVIMQNYELFSKINVLNRRLETEISTITMELLNTNSRLINKAGNMKALSEIVILATATSDIKEIFAMVAERVKSMISVEHAGFFIYYDDISRLMPFSPFFGLSDEKIVKNINIDEHIFLGSIVKEEKSFMINDPVQAKEALNFVEGLLDIKSVILVPLIIPGKKPLGIFAVANKIGGYFLQEDINLMELLADRISGSVESMKLNRELEKTVQNLTAVNEISTAISSEPIVGKIIQKVIETISKAFKIDVTDILLYDKKSKKLISNISPVNEDPYSVSTEDGTNIVAKVYKSGEPFLSWNVSEDVRIKDRDSLLSKNNSLIIVPLKTESGSIGVLIIGKKEFNFYNDDNLKLASMLANQAAIIIENANLYNFLKEANIELEQLNATKNEFITMVSNDINVPVLAIEGFVKVVLSGRAGSINPQQEKFLKISYQSMDKLAMLVSNFMEITKLETGQIMPDIKEVRLKDIFEKIAESIKPDLEPKNLTLKINIPEIMPPLSADGEKLIQIITNIILNCTKLALEGSSIEISAAKSEGNILFKISENGIGIPVGEQNKIFEKFYPRDSILSRLIPVSLALCKKLVEMHRGQINIDSDTGRGAIFSFNIPQTKVN